MVKVRGKIHPAYKFVFLKKRTRFSPLGGLKVGLRMLGGRSALTKTTIRKTEPSEKQLQRRRCYSYCEELFHNMTDGQFVLWKRFYWWARARGWTLKKVSKRVRADEIKDTKKHMGYRAFWMSRCLREVLGDYISSWLKAEVELVRMTEEDGNVCFTIRVTHREDVKLPIEPRDYKIERIRF